jgi:hypothetical protein
MRRLIALTAALLVTLAAGSAFAQTDDGPDSQIINIDPHEIEGGVVGPQVEDFQGRTRKNFKRLSSLKKSFKHKIAESTDDSALD